MISRLLTTAALALSLATTALAQQANRAQVIEIKIRQAAPTEPALKFRLLPDPSELTSGDAAQGYLVAFGKHVEGMGREAFWQMLRAEPGEFPLQQAKQFIRGGDAEIAHFLLEVAGRRQTCTWQLFDQEQGFESKFYSGLGGQAQWYSGLLSLRTRVAIAEHHPEEAVRILRTGFALGKNLSTDAPLGQALDGLFVDNLMAGDVRQLLQQPDAPNLYWPLVNLPSRSSLLARIMEIEGTLPFRTFPGLRHPERLSAEESREILRRLPANHGGPVRELGDAGTVFAMMRAYPAAKRMLIQSGMPADVVEALPADSVVLAYDLDAYRRTRDRLDKWLGLPPWQAYAGARKETEQLQQDWDAYNPLLALLPEYPGAILHFALADRRVAMLAVVEGIRAYAAAHGGALPSSINQLSPQTPAPIDPVFGRPFGYAVSGNVVTIHADAPSQDQPDQAQDWHITLVQ